MSLECVYCKQVIKEIWYNVFKNMKIKGKEGKESTFDEGKFSLGQLSDGFDDLRQIR